MRIAWVVLLVVVIGFASGCAKPKLIPNTKIADIPIHREIIGFVEKYRKAMERRDAAAILALVHPSYQDHSGTPESSDDLDYNGLKNLLKSRFKRIQKIRYRIDYQHIAVKGREAELVVYIDGSFIYQPNKGNPRYQRLPDHNRFRLIQEGKTWLFIGGL